MDTSSKLNPPADPPISGRLDPRPMNHTSRRRVLRRQPKSKLVQMVLDLRAELSGATQLLEELVLERGGSVRVTLPKDREPGVRNVSILEVEETSVSQVFEVKARG